MIIIAARLLREKQLNESSEAQAEVLSIEVFDRGQVASAEVAGEIVKSTPGVLAVLGAALVGSGLRLLMWGVGIMGTVLIGRKVVSMFRRQPATSGAPA